MLSDVPQWVALYTSARAEKKVSARLNQMGIETYIPTQRRLHKWSDRMKWVEVPLLPSYLFARINIRQESMVRYVDGLAWSIKFDGHTATIPDSEMQAMMDMVNSDKEVYVKNLSELRQGVQVRVIAGSFAGQEGYIYKDKEKKGKGKDRFGVSIDVLGKVFVVDLDEDVLEVVDTKKENTPKKKYNI